MSKEAHIPSESCLQDSASSRSLAVAGSMVNTHSFLKNKWKLNQEKSLYYIFLKHREKKKNRENGTQISWDRIVGYLRSLLLESSWAGMLQGQSWGRQFKTSSENSEKSTSYSVMMPSVSGSISPACPNVFASLLEPEKNNFYKEWLLMLHPIIWRKYR